MLPSFFSSNQELDNLLNYKLKFSKFNKIKKIKKIIKKITYIFYLIKYTI